MQKKDLKIGGYYVSNNTCERIFKYTDPSGSENKYIIKEHKKLYQDCGGVIDLSPGTLVAPFTAATQEQIDHLDACIAAGKYVEAPEKPKFEVGKWYKNLDSSEQWIGKFEKQYSNTLDFGGYEFIDNIGEYHKTSSLSYLYSKNAIEIADLQEIQQYLPEGHPDRIDTVPEYVECLENYVDQFTKGKIYKTRSYFGSVVEDDSGYSNGWSKNKFKPSTKEAYLAQHGKSEELTELPEKWCLKVTSENAGTLNQQSWYDIFYAHRIIGRYICGDYFDFRHHSAESYGTEITFEQFKKWVLKEEKSIEPWSVGTYVVLIENYSMVQKGGIYKIDDKAIDKDYISITESVGDACLPYKSMCKWFATKEGAEKFAETLKDKPKGITPERGKWYEIEDEYGEYYLVRYKDEDWEDCECIIDGEYEKCGDFDGEIRIIAEIPSNDPKITGPLLEYAKKKYPVGTKYLYRTTEIVKGSLQYYPSPPQITDGHGGSVYFKREWAEIISLPEEKKEKPKSTHKFKVGDSVKIIESGYGISKSEIGKVVTITELGTYNCGNGNGYKISPALGNSESSSYKGFNGEASFELVKEESKLEEANRRFKVGMKVKTPWGRDLILTKEHFPLESSIEKHIYTKGGWKILYDSADDKWATVISEEKVEESWFENLTFHPKIWQKVEVEIEYKEPITLSKYQKQGNLDLISFDDEPIIFSKPNKVNSINTELLIVED